MAACYFRWLLIVRQEWWWPGGPVELSRGQRPRSEKVVWFPPRRGGGTGFPCVPAPLRGAGLSRLQPGALPPAKFPQPSGLCRWSAVAALPHPGPGPLGEGSPQTAS